MDDIEKTIKTYDETAFDYAENVKDMVPSGWEYFSSLLNSGSYILDVGCGSGKDARLFVDDGHRVLGMDLSTKLIGIARDYVPEADFSIMDMRNMDLDHDSFDAIWRVASLVHVPKNCVDSVLKSCYDCLKTDGVMYVSVKRGEGEVLLPDQRYGGKEKFWSFFNDHEIQDFILGNGFEVISDNMVVKEDDYATHPWIDVFCRKL